MFACARSAARVLRLMMMTDAVMRLAFRQVDEVVAVAGHQKTTVLLCKLEDNEIFGLLLEHIAEARDFVAEFLE